MRELGKGGNESCMNIEIEIVFRYGTKGDRGMGYQFVRGMNRNKIYVWNDNVLT